MAGNPKEGKIVFSWLKKLKEDLKVSQTTRGVDLQENLGAMFGKDTTTRTFETLGKKAYQNLFNGGLFMSSGTGILHNNASEGTKVENHNFHGKED